MPIIITFDHSYHKIPLSNDLWILGSVSSNYTEESELFGLHYGKPNIRNTSIIYRLQRGREILYSMKYKRVKQTNSFTISYKKGSSLSYGQIILFSIRDNKPAVLVRPLETATIPSCFYPSTQIIPVKPTCTQLDVITVESICLFMNIDSDTSYITNFPNALNID